MLNYPRASDCFDCIVIKLSVKLTTSKRRLVAFGHGNSGGRVVIMHTTSSNVNAARNMVWWLSLGIVLASLNHQLGALSLTLEGHSHGDTRPLVNI